jgi:hypothetical protein
VTPHRFELFPGGGADTGDTSLNDHTVESYGVIDSPPPLVVAARGGTAGRRFARFGVGVGVVVVALLALRFLAFGLAWTTWRAAIPSSCRQPTTIDYSTLGRPDYGPYSVKLQTWRNAPWGESSHAVVGHGQSADSRVDYGVEVTLDSTDIERFHCRWTETEVTIVEPPRPNGEPGQAHVVPAARFLGGR